MSFPLAKGLRHPRVVHVHSLSWDGAFFEPFAEVNRLEPALLLNRIFSTQLKFAGFDGDREGHTDTYKVWLTLEAKI